MPQNDFVDVGTGMPYYLVAGTHAAQSGSASNAVLLTRDFNAALQPKEQDHVLPDALVTKVNMYATGALAPEYGVHKTTAFRALVLAGRLKIALGRTPAIGGADDGCLDVVVRLNERKKLYIEVQPDGAAAYVYDREDRAVTRLADGADVVSFAKTFAPA